MIIIMGNNNKNFIIIMLNFIWWIIFKSDWQCEKI